MNTKTKAPAIARNHSTSTLICLALICLASSAFAASQTWKAAPTDAYWTNTANWSGGAAPGSVNPAANALSGDTATFNAALSGTIGGAGYPITNDYTRDIKFITFDTASCGAYVIGTSPSSGGTNILQVTATTYPGGAITVNSTVVNPQVINAPLYTRTASSSSGGYTFINNAASSSATLSINLVTNNQGSSRPMTFFLDGSNTGNNTIGHIDDFGGTGGAIKVTKNGVGTWILTSTNDLPQKTSTPTGTDPSGVAAVSVNAGKLVVQHIASLGGITVANLNVNNGGTLQIDGVTLNNGGITLNNGGTIKMNGSGTVNGVTAGTAASTSATLSTTGSGDVMMVGSAANKLTGGASDTVLHVSGPGTVTLAYSANYVGNWSVDAGTLSVSNAANLGTGTTTTVAAGGTLDFTPAGAVSSSLPTGLGGNGTGTSAGTAATVKADPSGTIDLATGTKPVSLTYTPTAFTGDTAHPALYISQGTLALNGNAFTVNNASGTALGVGTYRLIQQVTGNVTDAGVYSVAVVGSGLAAGTAGAIQVSGGNVNLVVTTAAGAAITWQGDGGANSWDVNSTFNFTNSSGAAVKFQQGDKPTFNDTSVNPTVNLTAGLQPGSVTVTANVNNYSFNDANGSGLLSGSGYIVKNGSSTLTVATANINSGGTLINAGTVQVGNNGTKGDLGSGAVTNNGNLVFYQSNNHSQIGVVSGSGNLTQQGSGVLTLISNSTYTGWTYITNGTLQVGTNGATGSLGSGAVTNDGTLVFNKTGSYSVGGIKTGPGLGGALTFSGAGTATLSGGNTYVNNTAVNAGVVKLGANEAIPSAATVTSPALSTGWLTIDGGSTTAGILDLSGFNQTINALSANNGTVNGVITNTGSFNTTNTLTIVGAQTTTFNGNITDNTNVAAAIKLIASGAGSLTLTKANTISAGTFVGGGGTLVFNGGSVNNGSITLSNLTTLSLSGSTGVGGSIFVPAGATATNAMGNGALGAAYSSGDAASMLVITGTGDISGSTEQFNGFSGTVVFPSGSSKRFSSTSFGTEGGTNTIFDVEGSIGTRNGMTTGGSIKMGALMGAGSISGGNTGGGNVTYQIGTKGIDSTYTGIVKDGSAPEAVHITKVGAGTFTLGGTVTNTGNMTISAGAIKIADGCILWGVQGVQNWIDNSSLILESIGTPLTFPNYINGTGYVTVQGGGTVTLNGAGNGYSGGTTIAGGSTLNINSVWALGGGAYRGLTNNNSTLQYANPLLNVAVDITQDTSAGVGGTNGGVIQAVTLLGNATIDVNGNTISLTNTVGNSGSGSLNVASTAANGVLILNSASTYTGGTTVGSGATLVVKNLTGSGTGPGTVTVNGVLGGKGIIAGNTTVNGSTYPGVISGSVGTTNTFGGNLTYAGSGSCTFNLGASYNSPANDMINLSSTTGNLDIGPGLTVNINCGATLDQSHDYVLFKLAGSPAHILNGANLNPTPNFVGATPAYSANYMVVVSNSTVVLHPYDLPAPIISSATATPNPLLANQTVHISVAASLPGGNPNTIDPNTGVTVDLSPINGSSSQPLIYNGAGSYTNSLFVDNTIVPGSKNLLVTVNDTGSPALTSAATITLTVGVTNLTWNGSGTPGNKFWSNFANWVGGVQPGLLGDSFTFAGSVGLAPDMENNYSAAALTFSSGAGSFDLASSTASSLTLNGNVTNNSANVQTFDVPVILGGAVTVNAANGSVAMRGVISGSGNLATTGNTVSILGTNTYNGNTTIGSGSTLAISGAGVLGDVTYTGLITNNGSLVCSSSVSNALSGVISGSGTLTVQGSAYLTLSNNNTYTGNTTISGGTLNLGGFSSALGSSTLMANGGTVISSLGVNGASFPGPIVSGAGTTCLLVSATNKNTVYTNLSGGNSSAVLQIQGASPDIANANNFAGTIQLLGNPIGVPIGTQVGGATLRLKSEASGSANIVWDLGDTNNTLGTLIGTAPGNFQLGSLLGGTNATLGGHESSQTGAGADTTWVIGALGQTTAFNGRVRDGNQLSGVNKTAIVKVGAGTLTLGNTNNTYTGSTTVSNGTLKLSWPTLNSAATVAVSSGAHLYLDNGVQCIVTNLVLNGVLQPGGTYNSSTPGGYITGSGSILVPSVGPSGPASIASSVTTSGGVSTLHMTWPSGQGWVLKGQTNSLSTGLNTNSAAWGTVTGGSDGNADITIDPTKPTVFYRLMYP
jgi:autotransporter-associated beta strand protein